jgi:alpha-1,3-glucosyltransferase
MKNENMVLFWQIGSWAVKIGLMWGYHSTDFEVHRNWMAITFNEPITRWYFNDLSIWTLDYPPFFAYFEWCLAQIAVRIDPTIVALSEHAVATTNVIMFQRGSVMITELLLDLATWRCMQALPLFRDARWRESVQALLLLNGGLIMVDHMHFQYNGMLLGVLVLSFDACARGNYITMATLFSVLVLSKHLFMTLAPVYAVFLWRHHCVRDSTRVDGYVIRRFLGLVLVALVALALCFGPVLLSDFTFDDLTRDSSSSSSSLTLVKERFLQILARLFPFGRGLVHSYWAPNVWAVYYFFDRLAYAVLKKLSSLSLSKLPALSAAVGTILRRGGTASSTVSGLVGGVSPSLFKDIPALFCMLLVLLFTSPALYHIMTAAAAAARESRSRSSRAAEGALLLIKSVVYTSLTAFMLGYHVHEKAILVPLVAQTFLLAGKSGGGSSDAKAHRRSYRLYFELAVAGVAGLLPLFTQPEERYRKIIIFYGYVWLCYSIRPSSGIGAWNKFMLTAISVVVSLTEVLYPYLASPEQTLLPGVAVVCSKYEFVPLLLTSVTCAFFLLHAWWRSLEQLRS